MGRDRSWLVTNLRPKKTCRMDESARRTEEGGQRRRRRRQVTDLVVIQCGTHEMHGQDRQAGKREEGM